MSTNHFLNRLEARAANSHGKAFEKRAADSLAARLTPASGAKAGAKGDMVVPTQTHRFLMESKSTTAVSLSVKLEWLTKITSEATAMGMSPALLIGFVTPAGKPLPHCEAEWVAIPKQLFQELTGG